MDAVDIVGVVIVVVVVVEKEGPFCGWSSLHTK